MSPTPRHLVDVLRLRAEQSPEHTAFTFLEDRGGEARLTFAELDVRARRLAHRLAGEGVAGQPVLLCYPPGLEYLVGFFGCLYAGAIAVPAFPPDPVRQQRTLPRLRAILQDCQAGLALTPAALLRPIQDLWAEAGGDTAVRFLASDTPEVAAGDAEVWQPPELDSQDLAFLMYTSGSTGLPKGVRITHGNGVHNLTAFHGFAQRPCRTMVSWLPLFHDLGLVVATLYPVYHGAHGVVMSPLAFMQRPLRWLETVSRFRATTIAGPNFAYELCVRRSRPEERVGLDLSSLNLVLNGAEPVRARTLDRFTAAFAPHGFRRATFFPAYGLSDNTADASGAATFREPALLRVDRRALERFAVVEADPGKPESVTLVGCGQSLPGQRLLAVDPETRRPLEDGRVGELWISGPSVGDGYWNRPEDSAERFGAQLAEGVEPGGAKFFRTGDLGFWHGGEIYIIGRLTDMLILHGGNYFPEDIEPVAEASHPALRRGCSAVFGVEVDDEERPALLCEVDPDRVGEAAEIFRSLRRAVAEHHELEMEAMALIAPGELLKTSSGKVRRRACRERWQAGEMKVLASWRRRERPRGERWTLGGDPQGAPPVSDTPPPPGSRRGAAIEAWLVRFFADRVGLPLEEVDVRQPFAAFGLPSIEAVSMVGELADWLALDLPPTLAWDHPNIRALAKHLGGATPNSEAAPERPAPKVAGAEPIALIGMACRFPGANSLEEFWDLLIEGRDALRDAPPERWDAQALFNPDPAAPGKVVSRRGGFVEGVDRFDAAFFELTPREAVRVDPRQRLLLEVAWEALEDAGLPRDRLAGSATAVYIAALNNDWQPLLEADPARIDAYAGAGQANSVLANRLSYFLDLRGPSMTLDTACSGSLAAMHLACQSLRSGEADLALAGGVNLNLLPNGNIFFSKIGALSADGRSKSFDHRADGLVRSDGAGVVLLKPLSAALADGDPVHAVLRGSAVNQDGRSDGLMAPSGPAQEAVLRAAYQRAGLPPGRVQYIEAHGTGTRLGDPIEARALGAVLAEGRPAGRRWLLGSVKSNLGHMEAAAGVGGVLKVALAMRHRKIPPNLHFEAPNPLIPLDQIGAEVPVEARPWPQEDERLLAGVSSFGFGGTNSHVILEEAPVSTGLPVVEAAEDAGPFLLPLSARSPQALRDLAESWLGFLATTDAALTDIVYSARQRRTHFEYRLSLLGEDRGQLQERLADFLEGRASKGLHHGEHVGGRRPELVFVFGDRGAEAPEVANLVQREPVFRAHRERYQALFRERFGEARGAEPAAAHFVFQIALAAQWRSWGIEPTAVLGVGLGEAAAAHVAGVLSPEDAALVVAHRGGWGAEGALVSLQPQPEAIPLFSPVTAEPVFGDEMDAAYWDSPTPNPPRLEAAFRALRAARHPTFLEIGPRPALGDAQPPSESAPGAAAGPAPLVLTHRGHGSPGRNLLANIGALYARGHALRWERLAPKAGRPVALPGYPWQRRRYWLEPDTAAARKGAAPSPRPAATDAHPLLGAPFPVAALPEARCWESALSPAEPDYLADHRVVQAAVVPAAAYLEMALSTGLETAAGQGALALHEIAFERALVLDPDEPTSVQTVQTPGSEGQFRIEILSRSTVTPSAPWRRHLRGVLAPATDASKGVEIDLAAVRARLGEPLAPQEIYRQLARRGLHYGPAFQSLQSVWRSPGEALSAVRLPALVADQPHPYRMHPVLLDALFQTAALAQPDTVPEAETWLPVAVDRLVLRGPVPAPRAGGVGAMPRCGLEPPRGSPWWMGFSPTRRTDPWWRFAACGCNAWTPSSSRPLRRRVGDRPSWDPSTSKI